MNDEVKKMRNDEVKNDEMKNDEVKMKKMMKKNERMMAFWIDEKKRDESLCPVEKPWLVVSEVWQHRGVCATV